MASEVKVTLTSNMFQEPAASFRPQYALAITGSIGNARSSVISEKRIQKAKYLNGCSKVLVLCEDGILFAFDNQSYYNCELALSTG